MDNHNNKVIRMTTSNSSKKQLKKLIKLIRVQAIIGIAATIIIKKLSSLRSVEMCRESTMMIRSFIRLALIAGKRFRRIKLDIDVRTARRCL